MVTLEMTDEQAIMVIDIIAMIQTCPEPFKSQMFKVLSFPENRIKEIIDVVAKAGAKVPSFVEEYEKYTFREHLRVFMKGDDRTT